MACDALRSRSGKLTRQPTPSAFETCDRLAGEHRVERVGQVVLGGGRCFSYESRSSIGPRYTSFQLFGSITNTSEVRATPSASPISCASSSRIGKSTPNSFASAATASRLSCRFELSSRNSTPCAWYFSRISRSAAAPGARSGSRCRGPSAPRPSCRTSSRARATCRSGPAAGSCRRPRRAGSPRPAEAEPQGGNSEQPTHRLHRASPRRNASRIAAPIPYLQCCQRLVPWRKSFCGQRFVSRDSADRNAARAQ